MADKMADFALETQGSSHVTVTLLFLLFFSPIFIFAFTTTIRFYQNYLDIFLARKKHIEKSVNNVLAHWFVLHIVI